MSEKQDYLAFLNGITEMAYQVNFREHTISKKQLMDIMDALAKSAQMLIDAMEKDSNEAVS